MSLLNLTPAQLRQAADLQEQIGTLQKQLAAIFGGSALPASVQPAKPVVAKQGGMSAAGKARIVAAQKRRWAKVHAAKATVAKSDAKVVGAAKPAAAKKKFTMSAAAKAKISVAAKARWAKVRAAQAAKKK